MCWHGAVSRLLSTAQMKTRRTGTCACGCLAAGKYAEYRKGQMAWDRQVEQLPGVPKKPKSGLREVTGRGGSNGREKGQRQGGQGAVPTTLRTA